MPKSMNKTDKNDRMTPPLKSAFGTLKYFLPIAWRVHKGYFICSAINVIISALRPFVSIIMIPLIINELLGARDVTTLIIYAAVDVIGGSVLSLVYWLLTVVQEKYDEKFQNYFTEQISKRVMELDFQLTENKEALDQVEAARTGMSWYSGGIHGMSQQLFSMLSAIITIFGVLVLIALNAPILLLITAVLLFLSTIIKSKLNKIEIEAYKKLSKMNRLFGYFGFELTDFRFGKDIRLYGANDMMVNKWRFFTKNQTDTWKWQADKQLPLNLLNVIVDTARDFGSYLYLGILAILGKISIGTFSQMLSAGGTLHQSMQTLIGSVQEIIKRTNYANEYIKFMNYPAAIEKGTKHIENKPHTIEFRNVSFTYPNTDVRVLNDVSITIKQGEHLSVVGLNGAGKTTFIKLLCRLYDPTDGEILLDGVNIKQYDYGEYMSVFAPVFQDFKLFSFSVRENIVLDGECEDSELDSLITQVGLADKINSYEKGTGTMLFKAFDKNGVEPSGGEQQKLAIARALFKKSPVVILDEPTAALDPVAEYDIYRQFDTLVGGKTAVYISHRLSSCRFCDRIAVFSDGRISEYGTHDGLVDLQDGIYAEMFAAQAQYYRD